MPACQWARRLANDGATPSPHEAFTAPGHTPGLFALRYHHAAHGRVVIASDAIKYPKEILAGRADLVFHTETRAQATIEAILGEAERIVPGHFTELRKDAGRWTWDAPARLDLLVR